MALLAGRFTPVPMPQCKLELGGLIPSLLAYLGSFVPCLVLQMLVSDSGKVKNLLGKLVQSLCAELCPDSQARRPTPVPDLHRDREHGGEGQHIDGLPTIARHRCHITHIW